MLLSIINVTILVGFLVINNLIICYGTSGANLQTVQLPITYTTTIVGVTCSSRNAVAQQAEGGNGIFVNSMSEIKTSPCANKITTTYWITIGY